MNLDQFEQSETAIRANIDNNITDGALLLNALTFLRDIVDPLEKLFGAENIVFHSGYRCKELNTAVGGNPKSQHMLASALDFHIKDMGHRTAVEKIIESKLVFDQLLLEGNLKAGRGWIHISLNPKGKQRQQFIRIENP